jgi:hypothetical protein
LQKEFPEENLAQKRVSRSKVCKRAFQKHILPAKEKFAKRLKMPLLMPMDHMGCWKKNKLELLLPLLLLLLLLLLML